MKFFESKPVPGLGEQPAESITIREGGEVVVNPRKPNEYYFGRRFFAELSDGIQEDDQGEPWTIYDGGRKCRPVFNTDTRANAERIVGFLDNANPKDPVQT